MARPLTIYQLIAHEGRPGERPSLSGDDLSRNKLATLQVEQVELGREPSTGGITLPSNAVSRSHGLLQAIGQHWFYQDTGSTNGSWLNGQKVAPNVWQLIKSGDYLQLGDVALELVVERQGSERTPLGYRSLLVFSRSQFEQEYPIPEFGRALVVGGTKADLKLDIDVHDLPSLVIERRGDAVAAFTISKEIPAYLNGQELVQTKILKDRDELTVDHYRIIFSDLVVGKAAHASVAPRPQMQPMASTTEPALAGAALTRIHPDAAAAGRAFREQTEEGSGSWQQEASEAQEPRNSWVNAPADEHARSSHDSQGVEEPASSTTTRNPARSFPWADEEQEDQGYTAGVSAMARTPDRSPFGKVGGVDETIAMDPALVKSKISGYGGGRFGTSEVDEEVLTSLEDKIWLTVGLLMVLALVAMLVWWLLSR